MHPLWIFCAISLSLISAIQGGENASQPLICLEFSESAVTNSGQVPLEFYAARILEENKSPQKVERRAMTVVPGPTDRAGDLAFDNSDSPHGRHSTDLKGYALRTTEKSGELNDLCSFTVVGWFREGRGEGPRGSGARLVCSQANQKAGGGIDLVQDKSGMILRVRQSSVETSAGAFPKSEEWIFYAVSYDSTKQTDNVVFYRGGKELSVEEVSRGTIAESNTGEGSVLVIGDHVAGGRVFAGNIGRTLLFGSQQSGEAALSQSQIEGIRQQHLK